MNSSGQDQKMRLGLIVIIVLGILTALEFWAALSLTTAVFAVLAVIALIKAGLIVEYFMHYSQLWRPEE